MPLANLFNIPGTPAELAQWSTAHATHHLDILNALYHQRGAALAQYILDPFDPEDEDALNQWSYLHQVMHQEMDTVLGISGFDLSTVDWQEQSERAAWIQLNAAEHVQAAFILGVG